MKAAAYTLERPAALADLNTRLADGGWGVKPVAGGQSLGAMLNLRLAQPETLLDLDALEELRAVQETPDAVRFGAISGSQFHIDALAAATVKYANMSAAGWVLPTTIAPCDTDVGNRVARAGIAPPPPTIGVAGGAGVCAKAAQATSNDAAAMLARAALVFSLSP